MAFEKLSHEISKAGDRQIRQNTKRGQDSGAYGYGQSGPAERRLNHSPFGNTAGDHDSYKKTRYETSLGHQESQAEANSGEGSRGQENYEDKNFINDLGPLGQYMFTQDASSLRRSSSASESKSRVATESRVNQYGQREQASPSDLAESRQKEFKSRYDELNSLAERKGFKNHNDYLNDLAERKGFKNHSDYKKYIAQKKGFNNYQDYMESKRKS